MPRILVVEDEGHLADGLRFNLEAEGFETEVAETGEAALERLYATAFDAIVLDVMLPGIDGFQVAAELRGSGRFLPILMLTARGRSEDVLAGFAAGADDYLAKPFDLSILLARINGLLRRAQWVKPSDPEADTSGDRVADANGGQQVNQGAASASGSSLPAAEVYEFGGKAIDFSRLELHAGPDKGAETLQLTLMEANLLRFLIQHEGRPVSRKQILEQVWGVHEDTDTRAIDNFIVRLRRYIEKDPAQPRHLTTVRGVGYRFTADPE